MIVTDVTPVPFNEAENTAVPVVFEARLTVVEPELTGLPKLSCRCTVAGPNDAVLDAAPLNAVEVNTNFAAAAAVTVSVCVAEVSDAGLGGSGDDGSSGGRVPVEEAAVRGAVPERDLRQLGRSPSCRRKAPGQTSWRGRS